MTPRRTIDPWSLLVAASVLALGIGVIWHGSSYRIGTAASMGSGFYPVVLGVILTGLAILNLIEVLAKPDMLMEFRLRPLVMVSLSLCAFAYLVRPFGLVPATFALVFVSALAEQKTRPLLALFTATMLSTFGVAIFVYGLRVPLAIIRW